MPDGSARYETDFHEWSLEQAAALRAAARAGSNLALDFENLAEEIEDLARRVRAALRHRLETITEHLLKLQFSLARDPRGGWESTVRRSRREAARLLAENPSLRPLFRTIAEDAAGIARITAEDLAGAGETAAAVAVRRHGGTYAEAELLGDWFPDAPSPRS